ncbi:MAG TPA: hypothetical protein VG815_07735 [Chloroflexota bacterium]|jgi:hypothetical protein|nr:hypothetical protein [Chloroflexota bacterium]
MGATGIAAIWAGLQRIMRWQVPARRVPAYLGVSIGCAMAVAAVAHLLPWAVFWGAVIGTACSP